MESLFAVPVLHRGLPVLLWAAFLAGSPAALAQQERAAACQHFFTVDGAVFEARARQARIICVKGERVQSAVALTELPAPAAGSATPVSDAAAACPQRAAQAIEPARAAKQRRPKRPQA